MTNRTYIAFRDDTAGTPDDILVDDVHGLPVEVVAGATSGTEYTEGDTDATITGTAIMWEDAANTLSTVNVSKPLPAMVTGNVAHDSAASGNPVTIAGQAQSSAPTAVTAGDVVRLLATLTGKLVTNPYALGASLKSGTTAAITDTTTTQVVAGVASTNLYITHIIVQNSHATVNTLVTLEEETSGTDLYKVYAFALGGGAVITLPAPIRVPTAGKGLYAVCGTTGANVYVSASGYTAVE